MNFKICRATIEDIDSVLEYLNRFMSLHLEGISLRPTGMAKEEVIQKLPDSVDCTKKLCLVAQVADKTVGCLTFSRHSKHEYQHCGEFGMTVLPEYWEIGIGRSFMAEMEKWCKLNQILKIELGVWSNNLRAINLYQKLGYKIEGKRIQSILRDSRFYDLVLMGKWLG